MSNASIYLCQPTCIDHAYINHNGCIVGGSINPDFIISGKIDEHEQVVVDFSAIKKQLKAAIDHNVYGLDHKLWLIEGYSDCKVYFQEHIDHTTNDPVFVPDWSTFFDLDFKRMDEMRATKILICSHNISLVLPLDAVHFVLAKNVNQTKLSNTSNNSLVQDFNKYMSEYISYYLHTYFAYVGVYNVEIETRIRVIAHTMHTETTVVENFNYAHGLKNSTSFGCQQPCHGHLSYMQVLGDNMDYHIRNSLHKLVSRYDNVVFINEEDIIENNGEWCSIEYSTEQRGEFFAAFRVGDEAHRIVIIDIDTTIENIIEHVVANNREVVNELIDYGATHLCISEGLSKGAIVKLGCSSL